MMVETWVIKRFFIKPDVILARLKESEGKPLPKSKWEQRMEDAQKMQKQMIKDRDKKMKK
jgi:YidC/Oxa1 family membrane protein insertase